MFENYRIMCNVGDSSENELQGLSEEQKKTILESFAKKVPGIRKKLRMSQTEFGEKLG